MAVRIGLAGVESHIFVGKFTESVSVFVFGQIVPFHAVMIPISVICHKILILPIPLEELSFLILDSSVRLEFDVYGIFENVLGS